MLCIFCVICLFPYNSFRILCSYSYFFVYLILSHLILDFEYFYHVRFPVFNVMQVKDKNKNFIIFNLVIKICLYTNFFLNNFVIVINIGF